MKLVQPASIVVIALTLVSCSPAIEEKTPPPAASQEKAKLRDSEKPKLQFHSDMKTTSTAAQGTRLLESLKGNYLKVNAAKSIGEAFDGYRYAIKKEWRETPTPTAYYVDYICWLEVPPTSRAAIKEGVVKRWLEIKFAVHEDGDTYIAMARRIEIKSDGMEHATVIEPADIRKIVTAIYENREIVF